MQQTFQIIISGQVQGVGFRPFVYNLAHRLKLTGSVCNNEDGVLIHVNTSKEKAFGFLEAILKNPPAISNIQSHAIEEISFQEFDDFKILSSPSDRQINTPLTPDFTICESCRKEIKDENNRRYGYAFTTCTQCGPRYALTTRFPFERTNTTVSDFEMCTTCLSEYEDPGDRRFHSQTNSCVDCGMRFKLTDSSGEQLRIAQETILKRVAKLILEGSILAIKNTNGYMLCCHANYTSAILRLRERKRRPTKPFALLYPSLEEVRKSFHITRAEENALTSSVGPIVILRPKENIKDVKQEIIAPDLGQLGVMLPSSALLILLMNELQIPIVATSGNIHGSPILSDERATIQKLSGVADFFLHQNLEITFPQDDSVVRFAGGQPIWLRRSRGLAPNYIDAKVLGSKKILAMGAHLKSTFALIPNSHLYVSQYFGNLDSYDVSERFKENMEQFLNLFEIRPDTVLIDEHPQYQSSILGRELSEKWNAEIYAVQHHKAHFASVLAEHDLFDSKEKILGVVWDGTGLGEDGAIWGGEFFSYLNFEMKRVAHFEYVDWLAGDKMAKEPRLSLLSMFPDVEKESIKYKFSERDWKVYIQILSRNTLKTSSVGRLFDAVGSLLGLIDSTTYEGEAAMLLENLASGYQHVDFIDFLEGISLETIPTKHLLKKVHEAVKKDIPVERIANSFIHTLALLIIKMARKNGFTIIACSGGVFQNAILVKKLMELTENQKIELKFNRILSSNDENISFGQFAYYQHIKK